jgi:hypothetical protein
MDERLRRNALIVGAIVLALLSITAGALIALSSEDRAESPNVTPSDTPPDEPSDEPTESPEPSESETPEPSESPVLEDGHHFVYVRRASHPDTGPVTVRFDLAYFYTGERAEQEAAERGDEVANDYYIVNDNPRLRTLPLADDVEVKYVLASQCCELQPWDIDPWLEAIGLSTNPSDYPGRNVPWWFTVEGGQITRIEQQYLP